LLPLTRERQPAGTDQLTAEYQALPGSIDTGHLLDSRNQGIHHPSHTGKGNPMQARVGKVGELVDFNGKQGDHNTNYNKVGMQTHITVLQNYPAGFQSLSCMDASNRARML
jgi:hypothetical protein